MVEPEKEGSQNSRGVSNKIMAKASKKISRITVTADVEHDVSLDPSAGVTLCHPDDTFRRIHFITKDVTSGPKKRSKKKSKGLSPKEQKDLNANMTKIYTQCKGGKWKRIWHNVNGEPSNKQNATMGYSSYNECTKMLYKFKYFNKSVPIGGKKER